MSANGSNVLLATGIPTTVDHTANQYLFCKEDGTLAVVADVATGVIQNDPDGTISDGATISAARIGISRVVSGAAVAAGASVAPDATSKARTAVALDVPAGVALNSASGADEILFVLLNLGGSAF